MKDAIQIILENGIDAVPVADDDNVVIGVVTKRLALRELYTGGDINKCIKDVMKVNPVVTGPDVDSLELLKIPIGSIPVVQEDHVVGLVTLADTVRACFSAVYTLQEELKTVIHSAHSGIITVDTDGNIGIINAAAEEMLNMSGPDILGQPMSNVFLNLRMREVINTGSTVLGEKFWIHDRILITSISQVQHNDRVMGAVAFIQDISDFENISQELTYTKQLKGELDTILTSSFDGIYLTDSSGKILRVNDAFTRFTGMSNEELIGKTVTELYDTGLFKQPIPLHDIMKGKPVTISQEVRTGEMILVTSNPISDNKGNVVRIVHNVRDITELNSLKSQLEKAEEVSRHYKEQLKIVEISGKYISKSQKSKELVAFAMKLSKIDVTVLILGESGVGKDVIADMLHENSLRKDKSMITINCAAIPDSLLESELFGYKYGAFTGAQKGGKLGAFELANGGTLFLDEVGELPLSLQAKLLRVIQKKEISKLGGHSSTKIDVRIIAATNRNLWEMVQNNTFRGDLFYRLNIIPIRIPPLRERKEEIPDLVFHFAQIFNKKYEVNKRFDERAIHELLEYDWPGNVRELENAVERSIITCPDDIIRTVEFLDVNTDESQENVDESHRGVKYKKTIMDAERELIENALKQFGTTRKAAEELGISQSTVARKALKYKIRSSHNL